MTEPLPLETARDLALNEKIPGAIADFFWQQTGGYPDLFQAVLGTWVRENHADLNATVRERLLRLITGHLNRFVKWLDPLEDRVYLRRLIKFYWDSEDQEAYEALCLHPWKDLLLWEEGLRAEALGPAALQAAVRDIRQKLPVPTEWISALQGARDMYNAQKYQVALNLLDQVEVCSDKSFINLFRLHARIMKEMFADGDKIAEEDTNWKALSKAVRMARQFLTANGNSLDPGKCSKLENRYDELEKFANLLTSAAAVRGPFQGLGVDILAGLSGPNNCSPRHAAFLLWVKYEASRNIKGPSEACQVALNLPEQIFRIWAFWRLGLNYYEAPSDVDEIWDLVEQSWKPASATRSNALRRAEPGTKFPTFQAFACFALQYQQTRHVQQESDFADLHQDLSFYEQVRNPKAHGWAATPEKHRRKYFDLIRRWLGRLLEACPDSEPVGEESFRIIIEPLPLYEF
jgi:hypothetical protein